MAIIFPINPQQDQQYTPQGIPITWQYDSGRNAWRVVRTGPTWNEVVGKPHAFPPEDHEHPIDEVTGLQGVLDGKQDISARGVPNGYPSLDETGKVPENQLPFGVGGGGGDWNDITNKPSTFPPSPHTHPVAQISDSGSTGQQLVRAPTAADARGIIGAIGIDDNARVTVKREGAIIGVRRAFNLHEGTNVTMSVVDDVASEEVDITINASGGGGGSSLVVSDIKPVAPTDNTMWLDTTTGIQFVYYNDGNTSQWIESTPYLAAMPAVFTKFDFPASPVNDQTYNPIPGATWKWSTTRGVWYAVSTTSGAYTKAEADAKFVDVAGDVMTGPLGVVHPPTADAHAASKQYVDSRPGLTVSDTPPASPVDGALWWESDSGLLYVRYNDGTSAQWVIASPQPDFTGFLRLDSPQTTTAAQQIQGRKNIYAAPFDAMAYNGMQVNGSMEISQEWGTGQVTLVSGTPRYLIDGFGAVMIGTGAMGGGYTTISSLPAFTSAVGLTCGTANLLAGASDGHWFYQPIEGYRWSRLGFGTASAQPVTISFWVNSTVAGTMAVAVRGGGGGGRTYVSDVSVTSGTWQYKTVTVSGDVAGTWNTSNGIGATISFCFGAGSARKASAANTWLAGDSVGSPATTNFFATVTQSIFLTGVTILPGTEAPSAARAPFIMRSYDQELLLCRRYYYNGVPPLRGVSNGASSCVRMAARHPTRMRGYPTITLVAPVPIFDGGGATTGTAIAGNDGTDEMIEIGFTCSSSVLIVGNPACVYQAGTGNITVDVRL